MNDDPAPEPGEEPPPKQPQRSPFRRRLARFVILGLWRLARFVVLGLWRIVAAFTALSAVAWIGGGICSRDVAGLLIAVTVFGIFLTVSVMWWPRFRAFFLYPSRGAVLFVLFWWAGHACRVGWVEGVIRPRETLRENGAEIVEQLARSSRDRTARGRPVLWPSVGRYETANEYFVHLREDAPEFQCQWFGGWGNDLRTGGIPWNVLAGAADCPGETPVLWTANLRGLTPRDFAGADPEHPVRWRDRLDPNAHPFGDAAVIVVRKKGAAEILLRSELTDVAFLGRAACDPDQIEVLEAVQWRKDPPAGRFRSAFKALQASLDPSDHYHHWW